MPSEAVVKVKMYGGLEGWLWLRITQADKVCSATSSLAFPFSVPSLGEC